MFHQIFLLISNCTLPNIQNDSLQKFKFENLKMELIERWHLIIKITHQTRLKCNH